MSRARAWPSLTSNTASLDGGLEVRLLYIPILPSLVVTVYPRLKLDFEQLLLDPVIGRRLRKRERESENGTVGA